MMSAAEEETSTITSPSQTQKRVLNATDYNKICYFIKQYHGLAIDCELSLVDHFKDVHRLTLRSILETELSKRLRKLNWRYEANAQKYLNMYEEYCKINPASLSILLNIARDECLGPVNLCRIILKLKYELTSKAELTRLMRYPHLIEDPLLSANVTQCLCSDSQDGPLVDIRRRVFGEEYEFKLKQMATEAGMHFYDENDLRRMGYDKTPDIKLIIPFLYKAQVINWIESKAQFGDARTHRTYVEQQLNSYCNRFGTGIIIYWFGYHEDTAKCEENSTGIIVLADFPSKEHTQHLDLSCVSDTIVTNDNKKNTTCTQTKENT